MRKVVGASKHDSTRAKNLARFSWLLIGAGQHDEGVKCCEEAILLSRKFRLKKVEARALGNLGVIYQQKGNYPLSLNYQLQALRIREEMKDEEGTGYSLGNLGNLYYMMDSLEQALYKFKSALAILEQGGKKESYANAYAWIGVVYNKQGKLDEAMKYHTLALQLEEEFKDLAGEARTYGNIANIYGTKQNYKEALNYFLKSLELWKKIGNKQEISVSLNNAGSMFFKLKDFRESEKLLNESLTLAKEIASPEELMNAYKSIYQLYEAKGNSKDALLNYKNYILYNDSLQNQENTKKLVQTQMQYDFDKKENVTKSAQEKKDALGAEELKQQKLVQHFMVYGLLVVILAALLILRSFLQKKKANKLLEEKNILIQHQKEIVDMKQKEIIDSIYYAKRIQNALITSEHLFEKYLKILNRQ